MNDRPWGPRRLGVGEARVTRSAAGTAGNIAFGTYPGVFWGWGQGESTPSHFGAKLFTV